MSNEDMKAAMTRLRDERVARIGLAERVKAAASKVAALEGKMREANADAGEGDALSVARLQDEHAAVMAWIDACAELEKLRAQKKATVADLERAIDQACGVYAQQGLFDALPNASTGTATGRMRVAAQPATAPAKLSPALRQVVERRKANDAAEAALEAADDEYESDDEESSIDYADIDHSDRTPDEIARAEAAAKRALDALDEDRSRLAGREDRPRRRRRA